MTLDSPFRKNEIREVTRNITIASNDVDFLLHRLRNVATSCLVSPLPVYEHLGLKGAKISSTSALSCDIEASQGEITNGSLRIVSNAPPSAMLLTRDNASTFWHLVSDQDKLLTNTGVIETLRQANPRIIPAHAFPMGRETSDDVLFSTVSDSIKPFQRKIATKIFSLLDVQGIESLLSERHGRLIHSKTTEGRNMATNISVDRWYQLTLYDTPVDVGYQLINSAVGRRKESLHGRIILQSNSEFLEEYAGAPYPLPDPKDFAANMASLLDDLEKQAELATAQTLQEWR